MKKGFTLIELLAVIVILAIISLIAIPTISKVVEKARLGGARVSAIGFENAIDNTVALNDLKTKNYSLRPGIYILPLNKAFDIRVKGKIPTGGWIEIDEKGVADYKVIIDDKYVVTKIDEKVTVEPKKGDIDIMPDVVYVATDDMIGVGEKVADVLYCGISASENINTCLDSGFGGTTEEELRNMINNNMNSVPSDLIIQKMLYRKTYALVLNENWETGIIKRVQLPFSLRDDNLKSKLYFKLELDNNGAVEHLSLCSKDLDKCFREDGDYNDYRSDMLKYVNYNESTWTKGSLIDADRNVYDWTNNENGTYCLIGPSYLNIGDIYEYEDTYTGPKLSYSFSSVNKEVRITDHSETLNPECVLNSEHEIAYATCYRGYR